MNLFYFIIDIKMGFDYTFEELQMKMKNEILFKNELIFSSI